MLVFWKILRTYQMIDSLLLMVKLSANVQSLFIFTKYFTYTLDGAIKHLLHFFAGVVQGIVTGIRGLCNGLGPALFGIIFYIFNVNLSDGEDDRKNTSPNSETSDEISKTSRIVSHT